MNDYSHEIELEWEVYQKYLLRQNMCVINFDTYP